MPSIPRCWIRSSTSSSRTRAGFEFGSPQRTLVCNRTGAALSRQMKLDAHYWRRHARQPVEFAKSVRTLADLGCAVLLEVGPQPVLTAAALRAWPDTCATPQRDRVLAPQRRRPPPDQRGPRSGLRRRPPSRLRRTPARSGRKVDLPTYPFQHRQYWFPKSPASAAATDATRTETVRLLEEGRIEELAALLGGAERRPDRRSLKQLAAQHNQQRNAQIHRGRPLRGPAGRSRLRERRPTQRRGIRLAPDRRRRRRGSATHRCADGARAPAPDPGAAGHPMRTQSSFDAALRTAVAEEPALRILHLAGLDPDGAGIDALAGADAAPSPGGHPPGLPGRRSPPDCATPIWLVTRGAQQVTGRTPSRPCSPACGDSAAPPRWNIPNCGVGWRIWPRVAPTTGRG